MAREAARLDMGRPPVSVSSPPPSTASPFPLLDADLARELVSEAALAPSLHNVQPARWTTAPGDLLVLLRAVDRTLPAADPSGHDLRASLGAAMEGASLAASGRGLALRDIRWEEGARAAVGADTVAGHEVVAAARVTMGGIPDPLAAYVRSRRSWRGAFRGGSAAVKALATLQGDDAYVLAASAADDVAQWIDEATWTFVSRQDYQAELWRWLRLDPADPRYRRDGITAEWLRLTPFQARLARVALRPSVFRLLQATGMGKSLVSEAEAVRSASGFLCYCPPRALDDYAVGRRYYRLWLQATSVGLALAGMAALVEHEPARQRIAERIGLPEERRLAAVFRAGRCPTDAPPPSPRLPVEELLIER
jgi:nitroreductase